MALAEATVRVVLDLTRFDADLRKAVSKAAKDAGRDFDKEMRQSVARTGKDASEDFRTSMSKGAARTGRDAGDEFDKNFRQGVTKTGGSFSNKLANVIKIRLRKAGTEAGDAFSGNVTKVLEHAGTEAGDRFADKIGQKLEQRASAIGDRLGQALRPAFTRQAGAAGDSGGKSFASKLLGAVGAVLPKVRTVVVASLVVGLAAAVSSLINFTASALPAAQAALLLPPALVAAAGAALTVGVAFHGMGDAFKAAFNPDPKKFAASIKTLSPAAKDAAKEFRSLAPALTDIRQATQQGFFDQFRGSLTKLGTTLLGPIKQGFVNAGTAAGGLGRQIAAALSTPQSATAVTKIFNTIQSLFVKLGPSMGVFFQGLLQFIAALAPAFERFSTALSLVIGKFGLFLQKNAANGKALEWAERGQDVLHRLGQIFGDLIGIVGQFFRAARTAGGDYLGRLHTMLKNTKEFFASAEGQTTLVTTFRSIGLVIAAITPVFKELFLTLGRVAPVIAAVAEALARGLTAAIKALGQGVQAAGPGLTEFANAVSDMLVNIGPDLVSLGGSLGVLLRSAAGLLPVLTGASHVLAKLVQLFASLPGPVQTAVFALLALKRLDVFDALQKINKEGGQSRTVLRDMAASFKAGAAASAQFGSALGQGAAAVTQDFFEAVPRALSATNTKLQVLANRGSIAIGGLASRVSSAASAATTALGNLRLAAAVSFDVLATQAKRATSTGLDVLAVGMARLPDRIGAALSSLATKAGVAVNRTTLELDSLPQTFKRVQAGAKAAVDNVIATLYSLPATGQVALNRFQIGINSALEKAAASVLSFPQKVRSALGSLSSSVSAGTSGLVSSLGAIPRAFGSATSATGSGLRSVVSSVGNGLRTLQTTVVGGFTSAVQRIPVLIQGVGTALGRLSAPVAGVARSLGTGLKAAASGLSGALGGPFGLAITGATVLLGLLGAANENAAEEERLHAGNVTDLAAALRESNGAITEVVRQQIGDRLTEQFQGAVAGAKELGIGLDEVTSAALKQGTAFQDLRAKLQGIVDANRNSADVSVDNPFGLNATGKAALGLIVTIDELGKQTDSATQKNRDLAAAIGQGTASMLDGTSTGRSLAASMKVLADQTASADERAKALKDTLDILSGGTVDLQTAQATLNASFDELNSSMVAGKVHNKAYRDSLVTTKGEFNLTTANGRAYFNAVKDISGETVELAQRTFDMTGSIGAARQIVVDARKKFLDMASAMGIPAKTATELANKMGLIPDKVVTAINLAGASTTVQELALIKSRAEAVPNAKSIHVTTLSAAAENALKALGITVKRVPGSKDIVLTAKTGSFYNAVAQAQRPGQKIITLVPRGGRAVGSTDLAQGGVLTNALGRIVRYASGGFNAMRADRATIVPPNTWRVIGDRAVGDEAFIPLNKSLRSRTLLATAAKRLGFSLLADGGVTGTSAAAAGGLTLAQGAIVIQAPYADPALVARATVNELARQTSQ